MQTFNIIKKTDFGSSFRSKKIIDRYNLSSDSADLTFSGEIDTDADWSVGLIVGASGTGKTTILKNVFGDCLVDNCFSCKSVIDDMPENSSCDDIEKMFNSVGFSSPPSWLKPYNVLSNGEKMRVELASALLSEKDIVAFDEFTSVVDRQVAKIASICTQKAVRRSGKKFIAVSCHYDVEEYLMPDWVFDTNVMKMKYNKRRLLQRPEIMLSIYSRRDRNEVWDTFKRYHYLSHSISNLCDMFVAMHNDKVVGMCAVVHFPHPKCKKFKAEHRTVVSPDWQGIGIGNVLSSEVASHYKKKGYRFISTTTNPAFIRSRSRDSRWRCTRVGRTSKTKSKTCKSYNNSISSNRITTSWEFISKGEVL